MQQRALTSVALAVLVVGACSDERRRGDGGTTPADLSFGPGFDGGGGDCVDSARLIYVVDSNNDLLSFKPDTKTFTKIGVLSCPTFADTPFSMGVDRTPTAWVLYSGGELFKVSTTDASCEPTTFTPGQKGFNSFGMGFSSNSAGSTEETLFIAGGTDTGVDPNAKFGTLSFPGLTVLSKGTVTGWPELTGTGDGKLWGFFPSGTDLPRVAELDKATGVDLMSFPLSSLLGQPQAWAFAHWGGSFYVFLQKGTESSTSVYKVDGTTGAVSTVLSSTGRRIVGAGVSTCAPTMVL